MPAAVDYEPQLDAITVTMSGCFTLDSMKGLTREVLARARENPTRRFLVDSSRLDGSIPAPEILSVIADYSTAGVDRGIRMAVVRPELASMSDDIRFFETACRNRGFNVRLFPSRLEAADWLSS